MNEPSPLSLRCAVVGRGRLGTALAAALRAAGTTVDGPLGRDTDPAATGAEVVLLAVPDAEIAAAAAAVSPGPLVGHCSGATTLAPLDGHEAFSLHPLMTVTPAGATFAGATAAVAGSTPRALAVATALAEAVGLRPVAIADADRAAYHAAASIAANFLVTLEASAEALAATAGLDRAALVPLARAALDNWASVGGKRALTGPIARGDEATVTRQRAAVAATAPELLELFDALAARTRALAAPPAAAVGDGSGAPAAAAGEGSLAPAEAKAAGAAEVNPPAAAKAAGAAEAHPPALRVIRTVADLRAALTPARRAGRRVGLVPTMGALHAGHRSLIARARADNDVVVVSLFVNPAQFAPSEDLAAYPRDEAGDRAAAAAEGADILFAPAADAVYPPGFATTVHVTGVSEPLEGAERGPGHFDGVALVVTKLLNMVQPDVAYFGEKDAQQVAVIRRVARDLDLPVRIETSPTIRDDDGLALSSRNAYLTAEDRPRALALNRALTAARVAIDGGARDASTVLAAATAPLTAADVEPEYVALVDPETFLPVPTIAGDVLVAVAARVGRARLIDNATIHANGTGAR